MSSKPFTHKYLKLAHVLGTSSSNNSNFSFPSSLPSIDIIKYGLPLDAYIIGSFQRDTEGSDLKSPKLIKGPYRLIQIIESKNKEFNKVFILLSGKRRQYVIKELENLNIDYKYFEMVNTDQLNELYNCLDLYVVASRVEGGPQAIIECALSKTPIISTDVGVASEFLHSSSIFNMENF